MVGICFTIGTSALCGYVVKHKRVLSGGAAGRFNGERALLEGDPSESATSLEAATEPPTRLSPFSPPKDTRESLDSSSKPHTWRDGRMLAASEVRHA